jgi:hypothetical protein
VQISTQLTESQVLIDVGSGFGSASLDFAKVGKMKLILQDRPELINGEAQKVRPPLTSSR